MIFSSFPNANDGIVSFAQQIAATSRLPPPPPGDHIYIFETFKIVSVLVILRDFSTQKPISDFLYDRPQSLPGQQ
jgi:hypothetical protein